MVTTLALSGVVTLRFEQVVERTLAAASNSTIKSSSSLSKAVDSRSETFAASPVQAYATVPEIARQVTVRILLDKVGGSGVIIARQGQTYTVLTCDHVVNKIQNNRFTILTPDGVTHTAERVPSPRFQKVDLALAQFTSSRTYSVAVMGDSNALVVGDSIYASGFPNWHWVNKDEVENTLEWGLRAYRLTNGKIAMLPARSLQEGYQLGYTNDIESGMSGGPVFNQQGQLIGINGRSKYPLQGIEAFAFVDGTVPSVELFRQMEALSWAIPIATFQQIYNQANGEANSLENASNRIDKNDHSTDW